MSDLTDAFQRANAFKAGRTAGMRDESRTSCRYPRGTIYYDDWHDGFAEGEKNRCSRREG